MDPVSDIRDTRVLIPRVRRGLEGAGVTKETAALEEEAVNAVIADAVANIILFTGGLWGHQLEVTERDPCYMAPVAWLVDPELTEPEGGLIVIQAQLDFLYNDLKATKVSQTIKDEATEWTYALSASAIADLLKGLREQRDKLIAEIAQAEGNLDGWVNLLHERDAWTDTLIEPWTGLGLGGQEFFDPRGF